MFFLSIRFVNSPEQMAQIRLFPRKVVYSGEFTGGVSRELRAVSTDGKAPVTVCALLDMTAPYAYFAP